MSSPSHCDFTSPKTISTTTEKIEALVWERVPKDHNNSNLYDGVYKTLLHNAKDFEGQHQLYMALDRLPSNTAEDLSTDDI